MRDGTWSARLALLKSHEDAVAAIAPAERQALREEVVTRGLERTEQTLRTLGPLAREILEMTSAQRRKHLGKLEPWPSLLIRYAAAAWSAKAVALFEFLERSSLAPDMPQKWAGPAGLRLVFDYEDWEDWLWPFEEPWPWPDDDDEEDD